ncbi:MAG: hypothetical protein WEC75_06410 [Dehalococcoidia bacterium]
MASERPGPFDRILRTPEPAPPPPGERDRGALYVAGTILGLALLLLILVLPPISILSGGGGDGDIPAGPGDADTLTSRLRGGMPKLPAGLVAASAMFELFAPEDQRGASRLTIPLREQQTDARNLALYAYIDGNWERLADAVLTAGGEAASGEVSALPGNVAVLRRSLTTLQVAGSIPAGATIPPAAETALTTLHPLVFIPVENGDVVGTPPAVPPAGYRVVPGIVAPRAEVVDDILRSSDLRARHATAIADVVKQGNFAGINVDYRLVNASLRDQFTDFVDQLHEALQADGRTLTLTLPMPVVEGGDADTGAYDWERLGSLADSIEMGGELDQELYFQNTEAALDFVTKSVDPNKILITVTSLSVERGGDGLRTMALDEALTLASQILARIEGTVAPSSPVQLLAQNLATSEGASGLQWDDTGRAVTFSYPGRGGKRTVWIANQFSAAFRLELAQRYGLAGVAFTDVSIEAGGADVWAPVQQLADSGSVTLSKPNGGLLVPSWASPDGQLSATEGDSVTWTAPATAGPFEVTLVVSDGVVRVGQGVVIEVAEEPDGEGE